MASWLQAEVVRRDIPLPGPPAMHPADSAAAANNSPLFTLLKSQYTLRYDVKDTAQINDIIQLPRVKEMLPSDLVFMWERKANDKDKSIELIPIKKLG